MNEYLKRVLALPLLPFLIIGFIAGCIYIALEAGFYYGKDETFKE